MSPIAGIRLVELLFPFLALVFVYNNRRVTHKYIVLPLLAVAVALVSFYLMWYVTLLLSVGVIIVSRELFLLPFLFLSNIMVVLSGHTMSFNSAHRLSPSCRACCLDYPRK